MSNHIVAISPRGQITIPKIFREKMGVTKKMGVTHLVLQIEDTGLLLKPLQTKEEFLAELEESEKDWEKNGGITLEEMKKKYKI